MTERLPSSSVPVRASGEPQKPQDDEYAACPRCGDPRPDHMPAECQPHVQQLKADLEFQRKRADTWVARYERQCVRIEELEAASASPSDDGSARPPQEPSVPVQPETGEILKQFDLSVAGVHLLDGPRPNYEHYDKARWHTRGISQGLKIARTILEEVLALRSASLRETAPTSASVSQRAPEER